MNHINFACYIKMMLACFLVCKRNGDNVQIIGNSRAVRFSSWRPLESKKWSRKGRPMQRGRWVSTSSGIRSGWTWSLLQLITVGIKEGRTSASASWHRNTTRYYHTFLEDLERVWRNSLHNEAGLSLYKCIIDHRHCHSWMEQIVWTVNQQLLFYLRNCLLFFKQAPPATATKLVRSPLEAVV